VNDHTDSSVSEVISEAGDAGTAVSPPDESVDAAVNRLGELDSTDVSQHPAIYEDIHRSLASALDATPTTQADQ
jgi:hypothetical protein